MKDDGSASTFLNIWCQKFLDKVSLSIVGANLSLNQKRRRAYPQKSLNVYDPETEPTIGRHCPTSDRPRVTAMALATAWPPCTTQYTVSQKPAVLRARNLS